MTKAEKYSACKIFFDQLTSLLEESHRRMDSCNNDISAYLVPKGTEEQVSYYGKPANSFRISDHWSWYSNLKKCEKPHYIQCLSVDVPRAKKRPDVGKASKPIFAIQVSYIEDDGKYHCVYGEKFDPKTKKWSWVESKPEEVLNRLEVSNA